MIEDIKSAIRNHLASVESERDWVAVINDLRECIHELSPLKHHPVDFVRWIEAESVHGNEYNPNVVAPPEMRLLEHSVSKNGYTMPIVAAETDS